MSVAKKDGVEASGSLQPCAGQKSRSEAAIDADAMHTIFETDDTDAVLLIDVLNAFNALNRAAALHNINLLCPIIAIYAINTYRQQPARLFVIGGKEIVSAEGTSQGDPFYGHPFYGSICLQAASSVKQYWFADDARGAGSITEIMTRWDTLSTLDRSSFWLFSERQKMLDHFKTS